MPDARRLRWWLSLMLAALTAGATAASNGVQVGDRAPEFSLYDLDHQVRKLSDFRGNAAVLYFFGHNAAICLESARDLQDMYRRYRADGVNFIGIDCWDGTIDEVRDFRDNSGAEYPILLRGLGVARVYDLSYNSTLVLNRRGIIRYLAPGPDETAFSLDEIDTAIRDALDEQEEDVETTWGVIKSLYERSR